MVAVNKSDGPIRLVGCAPLYALQPKWTPRLFTQMTLYVLFIGASMATGGLMPWLLQRFQGWAMHDEKSLYKLFAEDEGYIYTSNNSYSFCPKSRIVHYDSLQRGFPPAPIDPENGTLKDAWYHEQLKLVGVSWFGFNNQQGAVDGLWAGGTSAATDLQAIVYQLKLLGFNTIRLPFTFDMLKEKGKDQVMQCEPSTKSSWARRATDPAVQPQPEFAAVPDPAVYLHVDPALANLCNTYLPGPGSTVLERLLWMVQYLVANGFYVVLDYHPTPDDPTPQNAFNFAQSWLTLWATISCLPNFSADIRGRLLLDLLNEPDKASSTGISWNRKGDVPGLHELYMTTMDSIEHTTPGDALFLLQGSAMTNKTNSFGLSPGDGFVTDNDTITAYNLSDPKPFFDELLSRSYRGRVVLAPHLYGPHNSGTPASPPEALLAKLNSSWGRLAVDGYCNADQECIRFPVVAGEMGSMLDLTEEWSYYNTIAQLAGPAATAASNSSSQLPRLSGWIWWAYNANSNGTGGLVANDWQQFLWPKLRFLVDRLGLNPWYTSPEAFIKDEAAAQADALKARALADAAAAAKAQAAAAAAVARGTLNLTDLAVVVMDDGTSSDSDVTAIGPVGTVGSPAGLDVPAVVQVLEELEVPAVIETVDQQQAAGADSAADAAADSVPPPGITSHDDNSSAGNSSDSAVAGASKAAASDIAAALDVPAEVLEVPSKSNDRDSNGGARRLKQTGREL